MKVLELFAGTRSIGKAFDKIGAEVFSVEWNKDFENIQLYADISQVTAEEILEKFGRPDVIWASPDCSSYSVAAIFHHRRKDKHTGELVPQTEYAKFCDRTNKHVIELIEDLNPQVFFIENPRAGLRTMSWMENLKRYTVTYCKYGDSRMKPTDIWTNHSNPNFIPPCNNGDPCHESSPRGTRTGTQGLKGSKERAVIPEKLCNYVAEISKKECQNNKRFFERCLPYIESNDCGSGDFINIFTYEVTKKVSPEITDLPLGNRVIIAY